MNNLNAPFFETLWTSLPLPGVVIDENDKIFEANTAMETFLNVSARSLKGRPVWDMIHVDAPLDAAVTRIRRDHAPLFVNNVDVGSGERAPMQCNVQFSNLIERPGYILLLMRHGRNAGP